MKENKENEEYINSSDNVFKQNKNMNITLKTGIKLDILQNKLIDINNEQNDKFNNAKECMNISIIGPENIEDNAEYNIISTTEIDNLSKILDSNIDKKLYTVLFSEKSSLTKNINSSWELIRQLQNNIIQLKNKESIPISFNKDENLFRTLHNATLIVEEYNNDTVMGYIYDKYDFKYQSLNIKNKMEMIASLSNMFMYSNPFYINNKVQNGLLHNDYINLVNDIATFLQNINVIKNYNIIVPIHIKL